MSIEQTTVNDKARRLWCAVILQAIDDATSQVTGILPRCDRDRARSWLMKPNSDFDRACHLAGMEPCRVRSSAIEKIAAVSERIAKAEAIVNAKKRRNPTGRSARLFYEYAGERLTIKQLSERSGMGEGCLRARLRNGWSIERAVSQQARGVVADLPESHGDRRGSIAQDCAEIEFSQTVEAAPCP